MSLTTRNVTQGIIFMIIGASFLSLLNDLFFSHVTLFVIVDIFTALFFVGLYWLAKRDWPHTGLVIVIFIAVVIVSTMFEPYITYQTSLIILAPSALAMVLTTPRWIIISALLTLSGVVLQAKEPSVYLEPFNLILYTMLNGCFIGSWTIANTAFKKAVLARLDAEHAASALQEANNSLEQRVAERTTEVQANLVAIQTQAAEQAHLLQEIEQQRRTIRELSVPVIPISDMTMVMPLVGELDGERLNYIHSQALQALERSKAHTLVVDITGVPIVDSQVAQGLMSIAQAARLLGGKVVLVGIRPEVAQTIVGLGLNISSLTTYSNLQSALARTAV